MHEVRLAETGAAVDKQRIVGLSRRFRHGDTGGMRELIGFAHDKGIKGIAGIQIRRLRGASGFLCRTISFCILRLILLLLSSFSRMKVTE